MTNIKFSAQEMKCHKTVTLLVILSVMLLIKYAKK